MNRVHSCETGANNHDITLFQRHFLDADAEMGRGVSPKWPFPTASTYLPDEGAFVRAILS